MATRVRYLVPTDGWGNEPAVVLEGLAEMSQDGTDPTPRWRERVAALKNIPPILRIVWEAAPKVIVST